MHENKELKNKYFLLKYNKLLASYHSFDNLHVLMFLKIYLNGKHR